MKADRLVSLLLLLQAAPRRTAADLARRLEVSERTIYRDVDALAASGVPVFALRGAEGGIALADGYRRAITQFSEEEIRALFIPGVSLLADLGLAPSLAHAHEKLRGGLNDAQRRAAEKARARIHIDQRRWNQADPPIALLSALRAATWDDRRAEIAYEDRQGSPSVRTVDPYGLVSKAGVWYLVASTAAGMRTFRADRLRAVRVLDDRFERDEAFDLDAYWREAAERIGGAPRFAVRLRVDSEMLEMVCGFWPSERDPEDGTAITVFFPSERAAVHNLASWGDAVDLLAPASLREALAAHARKLLERYAGEAAIAK